MMMISLEVPFQILNSWGSDWGDDGKVAGSLS